LFGSLSTTRSKPIHKLDFPSFSWPAAPFPSLKYPLDKHSKENTQEEDRCLRELERTIKTWHIPVAALIVEPIQAEGGDNHASPRFFREIRRITKELGVIMIVDEVQTGMGATGRFWAHEYWDLPTPPDIVTFSKKMQAAGFYHNIDLRAPQPYRNFNTWMGDPVRALLLRETLGVVKNQELVEGVRQMEAILKNMFAKEIVPFVGKRGKSQIVTNVRGQGTFMAFDLPTPKERDQFLTTMRNEGVEIGGCGEVSVRLRPSLVFQEQHANILFGKMLTTLNKMYS